MASQYDRDVEACKQLLREKRQLTERIRMLEALVRDCRPVLQRPINRMDETAGYCAELLARSEKLLAEPSP